MPVNLKGWLLSDTGLGLGGKTVEAFVSGTVTPAATAVTDAAGQWAFASLADGAVWDVRLTAFGRRRWLKGGRQEQLSKIHVVDGLHLGAAATVSGLTAAHLPITLASGTYTPTLTNVANLDASTVYACQYMRVGNVVTVSGVVDVDPTLTATATRLGISLPVASDFASDVQCGGVAAAVAAAGESAGIYADATNNRAELRWICGVTANTSLRFTFTYLVV